MAKIAGFLVTKNAVFQMAIDKQCERITPEQLKVINDILQKL